MLRVDDEHPARPDGDVVDVRFRPRDATVMQHADAHRRVEPAPEHDLALCAGGPRARPLRLVRQGEDHPAEVWMLLADPCLALVFPLLELTLSRAACRARLEYPVVGVERGALSADHRSARSVGVSKAHHLRRGGIGHGRHGMREHAPAGRPRMGRLVQIGSHQAAASSSRSWPTAASAILCRRSTHGTSPPESSLTRERPMLFWPNAESAVRGTT